MALSEIIGAPGGTSNVRKRLPWPCGFCTARRIRRACVERCEYAGLAIGVDHRRLLKSRIARELRHVLRTLRIAAVLGCDRDLRNPILQPLHRLVVPLSDLGFDWLEIVFR